MAKIEVFTAGTYLCKDVIDQVQQLACDKCEVEIFDLSGADQTDRASQLARDYGLKSVPSVVINKRLADYEAIIAAKLAAKNAPGN